MNSETKVQFLDFGEELVDLPVIKAASTSVIDFDGLLESPLKLHENLKEGCGGQPWPAGLVLARYMLRKHKGALRGKTMFVLVVRRSGCYDANVDAEQSRTRCWRWPCWVSQV